MTPRSHARRAARTRIAVAFAALAWAGCSSDGGPPPPATLGPGFIELLRDEAGRLGMSPPRAAPPSPPPFVPSWGVFPPLTTAGPRLQLGSATTGTFTWDWNTRALVPGEPSIDRCYASLDLDGDGRTDRLCSGAMLAWGGEVQPMNLSSDPLLVSSFQWVDFDDDGWLDLLVGEDRCGAGLRGVHVFRRRGPRSFEDVTAEVLGPPAAADVKPYALGVVRLRADREPWLFVLGNSCEFGVRPGSVVYRAREKGPRGLPRFVAEPESYYADETTLRPLRDAPMAAVASDFDLDGRFDLAVSLGSKHGIFAGDDSAVGLHDVSPGSGVAVLAEPDASRPYIPWGVAAVDVDQDGRDDLVFAHGPDPQALNDPAFTIGPQRTTVHWNRTGLTFADVTPLAGTGRLGEWHALTWADPDCDGDADLAVGGLSEPPRLYRNDTAAGNVGFSLALRGTTSNRAGVGARVEVVRNGVIEQRHLVGASMEPWLAPEPLAFVGLGPAVRDANLRIHWSSGFVQELEAPPTGRCHVLEEPALFTVVAPDRRFPADGSRHDVMRVTPRASDGNLREAVVALSVVHGSGSGVEVRRDDGGGWVASIVAPLEPAEALLELRLDGVALAVRPRIDWVAR